MDELKNTNPAATRLAGDEELKAKYGKVYRISVTVPIDDDHEQELFRGEKAVDLQQTPLYHALPYPRDPLP